ncbi:MAG: cysteine hydrolase [Micrococcales bacterium]|nr:cysteine hydrolase [Micrococcales bacterium]
MAAPWLVVIDPQVIFADPASPWGAPAFDEAMAVIEALAPRFGERVIVTRFVPGKVHVGSWRAYFKHWDFADLPATDPMYQLVPAAAHLSTLSSVDMPTFSKWGNALRGLIGPTPRLVLAGCATDCCVISTALAAADSGATVRVISDACAGSSDENHAAALKVMALYAPQIKVLTASQL